MDSQARTVERCVQILDALLSSADVEVIGVERWWERAGTAVETAAAGATDWPTFVGIAAGKLQIDVLSEKSSEALLEPGGDLSALLDQFRRNSVYIVALCRIRRTSRRPSNREDENK